ncbi:unnamed protein product [Oncorhynchus mykiss]|uniref:Uncharacterized protein n=1 Tax=Oncorhynchus mykiss TaxID=8022 RepID=A0A060Y281_ONCMY|nr:unnamed protein product [Oncorhynchus mykiss]
MNRVLLTSLSFCVSLSLSTVPDFSINAVSTNDSQERGGLGLPKVSGLERSQEKSLESCRDALVPPPAPSAPKQPLPPQPCAAARPLPLSLPSSQAQPFPPSSRLAQVPVHQPPRSEASLRPQIPEVLPLAQGQEPSQPPQPRPQHQPQTLPHPRPPPTASLHTHLPSTALPAHPPSQSPAGLHRPPSRCGPHPRPLSAYSNSLSFNGLSSRSSTPGGTKPHGPAGPSPHLPHLPPSGSVAAAAATAFPLSIPANQIAPHGFPPALQSSPHPHHPNMFAPPAVLPPPPPLTSSTLPVPGGHPAAGTPYSGRHMYQAAPHVVWQENCTTTTKCKSVNSHGCCGRNQVICSMIGACGAQDMANCDRERERRT